MLAYSTTRLPELFSQLARLKVSSQLIFISYSVSLHPQKPEDSDYGRHPLSGSGGERGQEPSCSFAAGSGPVHLYSAWGPLRCSSTARPSWSQSFHNKNLWNGLQIWLSTKYYKELILEPQCKQLRHWEPSGWLHGLPRSEIHLGAITSPLLYVLLPVILLLNRRRVKQPLFLPFLLIVLRSPRPH